MTFIQLNIAPAPDTVSGYAEDAVKQMQKVYGVHMDYSIDSLLVVDNVLQEWRQGGATVDVVTKSLYTFGSYAGEALRQREPARWTAPPDDPFGGTDSLFLFLRLTDGREWRPIAIAFNALMNGAEHSLHQSAKALLAG